MSRIGNQPVSLNGAKVNFENNLITVEGPKGKLTQDYSSSIVFEVKDNNVIVTRKNEEKKTKSLHGLYRQLLNNMVTGVTKGYSKTLVIVGVGYRVEPAGKNFLFSLGYSTQIEFVVPAGIELKAETNTKLTVSGIDKALVGQVAADVRSLRAPEPYKGKGIKYDNETIRRKVGKSGAKKK